MTIILAVAHSLSTNKHFQPTLLYLGTFMIDMTFLELLLK